MKNQDVFGSAIKHCRGLQLFTQLPAQDKVPNWNSNGLKDTITASRSVAEALDRATTTNTTEGAQKKGEK